MKKIFNHHFLRTYFAISGFKNLGVNIYNMVFVVYLATAYQSKLFVGLAESLVYIPGFFAILIGFLADKTRRKSDWLIIFSGLQAGVFCLVAYLMQYKGLFIVASVALLNVFSDSLGRYLDNVEKPIFKNQVADEDLEIAYSLLSAFSLSFVFLSQAVGVWLLTVTNHNYSLLALLNAGCFLMVAILYWRLRRQVNYVAQLDKKLETVGQQLTKMYEATKEVFHKADRLAFLPTILMMILSNSLAVSLVAFINMTLLTQPLFGLTYAQAIAVVGVVQILGSLLGGLSINTLWPKLTLSHLLLAEGVILFTLSIIGLTGLGSPFLVIGLGCLTFCVGRFGPKFEASLIRHVPENQLGQVSSFISFTVTISLPLATIGFSILAAYQMWLAWSIFLCLASLLLFLAIKYQNKD